MSLPVKLFHYSEYPLEKLDKEFHNGRNGCFYFRSKPVGFWISVEDYEDDQTWKTWCEAEEFGLERLAYRYLVTLSNEAKILHLKTSKDILDFGLEYQGNEQGSFTNFMKEHGRDPYPYVYEIRWEEVIKKWDGIIIAPYDWSLRLNSETMWYYSWDCASGCIWNIEAIKSLSLDSKTTESQSPQVESETD